MIDDQSVADSVMPKNAVRHAVNVLFDRPRGAVAQRYGTTVVGSGLVGSAVITGLHNFRSSSASNHQLLASTGIVIRYLNNSTWTTTVTGLTSGLRTRFLTYLDRVAFLNGTDASQAWDGTSAWETSGGPLDIANFPVTKYATLLNGRVCAAGNSSVPNRLYQSSIVSTSSTISWTSGNKNVDVFPNDGNGVITSLHGTSRLILIFKDRAFYRFDDNELQRIAPIGTPSNESVVTDDNGVTYFFGQGANTVGFYMTSGGFPAKLSRPVQKWVDAIDPTFYGSVAAYTDDTKVCWSIGTVTIDDTTYTNAQLVYNISDHTWEARNYADSFRVFSQHILSTGEVTVVGGDADSNVQTMNVGTTDNTAAINAECEFGPRTFGNRAKVKRIPGFITLSRDFQGLVVHMRTDDKDWKCLGSIKQREQRFIHQAQGQTFFPKITAMNDQEPFVFEGFVWDDVTDLGYVK